MEFLETLLKHHLLPLTTRLYRNQWMQAIRYTLFTMMPFVLAVSLAAVVAWVFLDPWGPVMGERGLDLGAWLTGGLRGDAYRQSSLVQYAVTLKNTINMSIGIFPLLLTMSFADRFAFILEVDRKVSVFLAFSAQMMLAMIAGHSDANLLELASYHGLFSVVLVPLISTAIFAKMMRFPILRIPRLSALPRKLSHYLTLAFPVTFSLFIFGAGVAGIVILQDNIHISAPEILANLFHSSPVEFSQELCSATAFQVFSWLPWWFGIHGQHMMEPISVATYLPAQVANQFEGARFIFCSAFFDAGLVHVIALAIAVITFSKQEDWRTVSKFSLPMLAFNIQDPLLFGMPVVMNPVFLLPFLLAPVANVLVGWLAISWEIVPLFKYAIPLGMPPILSGILSTGSIMGGILQLVWIIMDIFIYAPFIIVSNMAELKDLVPNEEEKA